MTMIKPVVLLLLLSLLSACSTVTYPVGPEVSAQNILLLPVDSMQKELVDSSEPIYQALKTSLENKRFQVIDTRDAAYQQAVDEALSAAGAVYNPAVGQFKPVDRQKYLHSLLAWYQKKQKVDVLIWPQMMVRLAKVEKDTAQWDHTTRKIELSSVPPKHYKPVKVVRGISLKLSAYSHEGVGIVQSYAGISLPFTLDYNQNPAQYYLKKPLYTEKEQKQAVKNALAPIFHQVKYHD